MNLEANSNTEQLGSALCPPELVDFPRDLELVYWAKEIVLRAERKAGEMLAELVPHKGGRPKKENGPGAVLVKAGFKQALHFGSEPVEEFLCTQSPMLGTQRRIEARIGQLLGECAHGGYRKRNQVGHEQLDLDKRLRHDMRVLATVAAQCAVAPRLMLGDGSTSSALVIRKRLNGKAVSLRCRLFVP